MSLSEVLPSHAEAFSAAMRRDGISVDTHNRKMRRLRKLFATLKNYCASGNPFAAKSLFRSPREERNSIPRRIAFTREQEKALLEVLDDSCHKVMHKEEIRVVYHLGMFTGQRMKDCVLLTWDRIDLDRRRIWVKQFKTGKEVSIPISPKLLETLKEARSKGSGPYVCPNVAERYKKEDARGRECTVLSVNSELVMEGVSHAFYLKSSLNKKDGGMT